MPVPMIQLNSIVEDLYRDVTRSSDIQNALADAARKKAPHDAINHLASQLEAHAAADQKIFIDITRTQLLGVCLYQYQDVLDNFLEEHHIAMAMHALPLGMCFFGIPEEDKDRTAEYTHFMSKSAQMSAMYIDHIKNHQEDDSNVHDSEEAAGPLLGLIVMMLIWRYNENGGPKVPSTNDDFDITEIDKEMK